MSVELNFKASPASVQLDFPMLFHLSRSLEYPRTPPSSLAGWFNRNVLSELWVCKEPPHPHLTNQTEFLSRSSSPPRPPILTLFSTQHVLITPRQPILLTCTQPLFSSFTLASHAPSTPIPSPPPTPTLSLSPPSPALSPGCGSGGGGGALPAAAAPAASRVNISVIILLSC